MLTPTVLDAVTMNVTGNNGSPTVTGSNKSIPPVANTLNVSWPKDELLYTLVDLELKTKLLSCTDLALKPMAKDS